MKDPATLTETLQKTVSVIPPDVMQDLMLRMATFEQALLAKDPMMPQHLKMSHQVLIQYPETVHLLDNADIAKLLEAAQVLARTQVVQEAAKGKGASKKKMTAEDL